MVRPDGLLPSWKSSALEIASNPKAISYWESELGLDPPSRRFQSKRHAL